MVDCFNGALTRFLSSIRRGRRRGWRSRASARSCTSNGPHDPPARALSSPIPAT